ncbi:MAG TPA: RNA polymerase factor sigma-54 [Rhodanobacteraceae bacterium]|nr:RNA polymerase factor sigma-54 [Rhodanobacteraceae bacterium]
MKPGIQLRLHQQLALTPQLQQAIRLLQLSQVELETELRELAETNPLLELDAPEDSDDDAAEGEAESTPPETADAEPEAAAEYDAEPWERRELGGDAPQSNFSGDDDDAPEHQDAVQEGLREHLMWQLNLARCSDRDRVIAIAIIDALDADGYLHEGLEPVQAALSSFAPPPTTEEIEAVRHRVQRFDPTGVASLDLRDCLDVQLQQLDVNTYGRSLALRIVASELELLARRDFVRLGRKLDAQADDVIAAATLIRGLDPRPGAAFDPAPTEYIAPDAYAVKSEGRWRVALSPNCQPRLAINRHYCDLIARARRNDATYLRGQLQEARWLMKSLKARADTLYKVAQAIVRTQSAFLDYGPEAMKPLVLREVADELGMHESTISRVTTRKYLHTPRGTFEFKHFFSSGVATDDGGAASATAIQAMIRKLVAEEDPRKPLSDQGLTTELNKRGIQVARRTVAKYREALRIPSSGERQRAG